MNDRVLVEALRGRDPGALAALYDSHAESVYRYCWSLLASADSAQVALRDTLIAAEAHIERLGDPDRLGAWLYALARVECLRRRPAVQPDENAAHPPELDDPDDADLRIMAWNAVRSLPAEDREILELSTTHRLPLPDVAAVLGVPVRHLETDLDDARERLRDAITAEILARKGPYDCPRRALILSGFSGELTGQMRDHLVRHLIRCEVCAPHRLRQVSAAKVFELLPAVGLPESLRVRVLSCFADPELVPYRRYVARRSATLDAAGFPSPSGRKVRRWPQALAGALAGLAAVVAIASVFHYFGSEPGVPGVAAGRLGPIGESPGLLLPWHPEPTQDDLVVAPILDSRSTQPLLQAPPYGGGPGVGVIARPGSGSPAQQPTKAPRPTAGPTAGSTTTPPAAPPPVDTAPDDQPSRDHHDRPGRDDDCPPGKGPGKPPATTPPAQTPPPKTTPPATPPATPPPATTPPASPPPAGTPSQTPPAQEPTQEPAPTAGKAA
ncbi:RNA polymerase sigma factor [Nonomuraea soli]|uniref:RNA polymerase sigma factor (Sigma-70 family) n=1 Tax=Nonomuraea soli TaxID=1032476 RepID=A0A7W0HQR2_9ACTN|nr:sigma-70 family RNA polymerase sigma factor [Nonomuraea soli]MBA2892150.1 RNA polymerase sigma factor (sigma-70 family) [Nonomuraea soli]